MSGCVFKQIPHKIETGTRKERTIDRKDKKTDSIVLVQQKAKTWSK